MAAFAALESKTTRRGATRGGGTSRTVSSGSSASTVPMPTAIASAFARSRCTSRRDSGPVIQRCAPVGSAIAAVGRERELERHPRTLAPLRVEERRVELAAPRHARRRRRREFRRRAVARLRRARRELGSRTAIDDARDARGDDRVDARRCLAVVRARLERHVHRRAARAITRRAQRVDLGVRLAVSLVKSLADDRVAGNDDGADHWVRRRLSPPALGERERSPHVLSIEPVAGVRRAAPAGSFIRYQPKRKPSDPYRRESSCAPLEKVFVGVGERAARDLTDLADELDHRHVEREIGEHVGARHGLRHRDRTERLARTSRRSRDRLHGAGDGRRFVVRVPAIAGGDAEADEILVRDDAPRRRLHVRVVDVDVDDVRRAADRRRRQIAANVRDADTRER